MGRPKTFSTGMTAVFALLGFSAIAPSALEGQGRRPSCQDRHGMEYRYVFVHVTRRAKDAPPPTGSGDERIRISYKHSPLRRVALCSFVHEQDGRFTSSVPVNEAWLELGGRPGIRLHSTVVHGAAIDIDLRPHPQTLTIIRHADGALMEAGTYRIASHPFTLK